MVSDGFRRRRPTGSLDQAGEVADAGPSPEDLALASEKRRAARTALTEPLPGLIADAVLPAPDGGSVYVAGYAPPFAAGQWAAAGPYRLYRLDAGTLAVQAERGFPEARAVAAISER